MRPVNLIPKEQRRAARGAGGRGVLPTYIFLGALGAAVLVVLALVVTGNQINDRKEKVAELDQQATRADSAAKALAPYGNFARLQQARVETVRALAESRFNWERVLRALSRTIPDNAWLVSFKGTVAPDVQIEAEGGVGGTGTMRTKTTSPAVELTGCTYDHEAVARMMVRMRNIDGVSEVALAKSERRDSEDQSQQAGGGAGAEGAAANTSTDDCRTKDDITKFEILIVLGNAQPAAVSAPVEGGAAPSPAGSAPSPAAQAQQAAATQSTPSTGGGQ